MGLRYQASTNAGSAVKRKYRPFRRPLPSSPSHSHARNAPPTYVAHAYRAKFRMDKEDKTDRIATKPHPGDGAHVPYTERAAGAGAMETNVSIYREHKVYNRAPFPDGSGK